MRLFRLFKKDMAQEVADWVSDGLIKSAQGEAILARYNIQPKDAQGTSLGYYVLTALATLFVGLALILLVSHNWDEIPRLTRMLLLFFITLAVNLQGMRLLVGGRDKAGVLWLFFRLDLLRRNHHAHRPDLPYWRTFSRRYILLGPGGPAIIVHYSEPAYSSALSGSCHHMGNG